MPSRDLSWFIPTWRRETMEGLGLSVSGSPVSCSTMHSGARHKPSRLQDPDVGHGLDAVE